MAKKRKKGSAARKRSGTQSPDKTGTAKSKPEGKKPGLDDAEHKKSADEKHRAADSEQSSMLSASPRAAHWQSIGIAALSGCLWFLSCADFDIWPLAWIAMVPTLWVMGHAPTRRKALFYGWITGVVANVGGFYWVTGLLARFGHLPLPAAILGLFLLASYQATVFWFFAMLVRTLHRQSKEILGKPLAMAFLAPVVMVSFELLVPFIFPWYLAITQAWVTPVIQIAEITGPLGVTALLMMINGAVFDALARRGAWRHRLRPLMVSSAVLAAALLFGFVRMAQIDSRREEAPTLKIGVVQGNIPFDEKGRAELAPKQLADLQSESAKLEAQGADLVMWTESSYPYHVPRDFKKDFTEDSPYRIRRGFTVPLMLGAVTFDRYERKEERKSPYNSALLLDSDNTFTGRFDKIFLLVFGEYTPFVDTFPSLRKWLPKNAGHFSRGEEYVTFPFEHEGQNYRLGPMICYEDILADFSRELAKLHPHVLLNITNDSWYGETSEPWEHLALSVYRSVELRTDLVRAVNTGVSAFVDANGRVTAETYAVDPKVHPKPVDSLLGTVRLVEGGYGFFARFGNVFGWLNVLICLYLWQIWPRQRRGKKRLLSS